MVVVTTKGGDGLAGVGDTGRVRGRLSWDGRSVKTAARCAGVGIPFCGRSWTLRASSGDASWGCMSIGRVAMGRTTCVGLDDVPQPLATTARVASNG